nr:reverse transcriptase domain-containing protein [Tanacetum cinerariifolium]
MESVHDMSGCRDSQRVKYTVGLFVGKALTWWNSKIRTRGREAAVGMSWEDFKTLTKEEFCPNRFHELARLVPHLVTLESKRIKRTMKKNPKNRGNMGEPNKDRNGREDNKRTRTENAFATTINLVRGGYMGTKPKCTACGYHYLPETPYHYCFNCNHLCHFAKDCRVVPRNPLSLSFDFVFSSEIFKSLSFSLDRICHLAISRLDQHAHTLHHLESLLTISLERLDILKEDLVY